MCTVAMFMPAEAFLAPYFLLAPQITLETLQQAQKWQQYTLAEVSGVFYYFKRENLSIC